MNVCRDNILAWMEAETNIEHDDANKVSDMTMSIVSEIYGQRDGDRTAEDLDQRSLEPKNLW